MGTTRPGCAFCFQGRKAGDTLDAEAWCACAQCGRIYHRRCWALSGACVACGCAEQTATAPPPAAPRRPELRTRALPTPPAGVVYVQENGFQPRTTPGLAATLTRRLSELRAPAGLLPLAQAFLTAAVLVLLAAAAGAYAYRLATLPSFGPTRVLDALFREQPPAALVFFGATLAGAIAAWVAYPRRHAERPPVMRVTRLVGGLIACAMVGLLLILSSDETRLSPLALPAFLPELLAAQVATALGAALLTPIYRRSAPDTGASLTRSLPEWAVKALLWARFALVALGISTLVALLAIAGVATYLNMPGVAVRPDQLASEPLLTLFAGSLAVGIGASAVFFWPPRFRNLPAALLLRLVTVAGSLLVLGLLYRSTTNSDALLASVAAVGVVMVCAIPLQRSLS